MTAPITAYLKEVQREFSSGIAAEHAYRPALKRLLESAQPGLNAINDPRRIEIGAPDFIVLDDNLPIGIVEAKDIGENLGRIERSEQMQRYLNFGNVILTDYLEFRWYVDGAQVETVCIAEKQGNRIISRPDQYPALESILRRFAQAHPPAISDPAELAARMAALTREIKILIIADLNQPDEAARSPELVSQKLAFEQTLLPELDTAQFADMYAQTLTYGLFTARVNYQGDRFSRRDAAHYIPRTNPFLRRLFNQVEFDAGESVTWLVDRLAELLNRTDIDGVLEGFGHATRQEDPVVHFYETFLAAYDPQMREARGVYYTPEPVVSYIVRSVDHLLRTRFGRHDGLRDPQTLVLDPATGTGTFLYFVIQHIYDSLGRDVGGWDQYVRDGLLPRLFGFELLMAPYAVAHMKLGLLLQDTGYRFAGDDRLGIYLTNTLDEVVRAGQAPFAGYIKAEANAADEVKNRKPIMVVLGNPPYSGHSANRSTNTVNIAKGETYVNGWKAGADGRAEPDMRIAQKALREVEQPNFIGRLIRDYYFVDGQPLGERNPKWLQDDYVKFIRFGQWRIEQTGEGVLAFVTNHGYLDNPTFRGMRQQLMQTFDEIYVLNLHGNDRKKEKTPDGGPDRNVFDIQQGVAIGLFIKRQDGSGPAKVYHADLWGKRPEKYAALLEQSIENTDWQELTPDSPFYLFVPQDIDLRAEYRSYWGITNVMATNVLGFQTHRDDFAIAFERDEMLRRIQDMRSEQLGDKAFRNRYHIKESSSWQVRSARAQLRTDEQWESSLIECAYRPFDWRHCYFSEIVMDRPRRELLDHVAGRENLTLGVGRQGQAVDSPIWHLLSVSTAPFDSNIFRRGGVTVFPLYLFPDPAKMLEVWDWPRGKDGRRPNLDPAFIREMEAALGLEFIPDGRGDLQATFGPEDVFHYIYAVFHSPTYRERYAEFLRIDFPRVPLTTDRDLFAALCGRGAALVALHLLDRSAAPTLNDARVIYPEPGDHVIERGYPKFVEPDRVYINKTQYFEGVAPDVWDFQIGGYQVLHKWLKDRRGRMLTAAEQAHYKRVVVALAETQRDMEAIDDLIPDWPLP